jgi:hypothetical protein
MGNLGNYQKMTEYAKNIGGPGRLLAATALTGYLVFRAAEAGVKGAGRSWAARRKKVVSVWDPQQIFAVGSEADCGAGLILHVGDEFQVLERDSESVLIEVLGNADNPHFVSAEILARVSDFPT